MRSQFTCSDCHKNIHHEVPAHGGGTGYVTLKNGDKICYACCGKRDAEHLKTETRATLYLTYDASKHTASVRNWCGTLFIICSFPKKGRHNIAGSRYDVWFTHCGEEWHGVQYGDNTQIVHCRKLKRR